MSMARSAWSGSMGLSPVGGRRAADRIHEPVTTLPARDGGDLGEHGQQCNSGGDEFHRGTPSLGPGRVTGLYHLNSYQGYPVARNLSTGLEWLPNDMQIDILPPNRHDHAASLGASQDLINTLELSEDGVTDTLTSPHAAVVLLAGWGLAHHADLGAQAAREGDRWLPRVHEARAAMREVWDAVVEHRPPAD